MGRIRRKKTHHGIRDIKRKYQIHDDLKPENLLKLKNQEFNVDLPGNGQFYCVQCAKYFMNRATLGLHEKTKIHKRRLKELKSAPYTQKEAEEAVGLKTDNVSLTYKNKTSAMIIESF